MADRGRGDFQEAAAPAPQLFSWGARALYVGPSLKLGAHRNAVAVLAIGLDAPFEVAEAPGDPQGRWRRLTHLLIGPDELHHLRAAEGRMAFLYVDPLGRDLERLRRGDGFEPLTAALLALADRRSEWSAVRARIDALLDGETSLDLRVRAAVQRLNAQPSARPSLEVLAQEAGLSSSRFRRLFRAATGVTVRRYRIWAAMGAAMRSVAGGASLTAAALEAGFSSSAHFSAAFREMFGLEPSRLAKGLTMQRHEL